MIKPRNGICLDCNDGVQKDLMAKRCFRAPFFHYQKHQQAKYLSKQKEKAASKVVPTNEVSLGKWFNTQISIMPSSCENCGEYLNKYAPWSARAYIAHIVPKKHFESVKTHPLNRLFLCIDCHANYDNWLSEEIVKMKVYPVAVDRFKKFMELIPPDEIKHLKLFLKDILFEQK